MVGTFGSALDARQINASQGRLVAAVRGEVESTEDGVLVIRRIHIDFRIRAPEHLRDTIDRVHGFFAEKCPIYRSLSSSIQITSSWTFAGG